MNTDNYSNYQMNYPQQGAQPQPIAYAPAMKKVYKPFSKQDNAFIFLFLIASFLFIDFALFKGFHLGFTISYFVIFVISSIYIWKKDRRPSVFSLLCGMISLVGAVSFALFSNVMVNIIMFFLVCGLFTLYCLGISGSFRRKQGNFKLLFDLVEGALLYPFANLSDVFGSFKAGEGNVKKHAGGIIGILLALPVLFVIVPLLISSDAAFEGLVSSIAKNIGLYLFELALAVLLMPYLFSFAFGKKEQLNKTERGKAKSMPRKLPISGCVSFLCMISLTYLVYLFSQLAYFFSAFKGFLPDGYVHTASEFARRGFFEMFTICVINVLIVSVVSAFSKRNARGKTSAGIKALSLFISLFSILLIATAMQKMKLNISTYGFTVNRLLVSVFMIMMLVVIVFFILHIFLPKFNYMQPIIIICSCIFVAISFADINMLTAEYNMKAYNSGTIEKLDVEAISDLGDASVKYLIVLSKSDDTKIAHEAQVELGEKILRDDEKHIKYTDNKLMLVTSDFRSYCRVSAQAWRSLRNYYDSLESDDNFVTILNMFDQYDYDPCVDCFSNHSGTKYYVYNEKTNTYEETSASDYERIYAYGLH